MKVPEYRIDGCYAQHSPSLSAAYRKRNCSVLIFDMEAKHLPELLELDASKVLGKDVRNVFISTNVLHFYETLLLNIANVVVANVNVLGAFLSNRI